MKNSFSSIDFVIIKTMKNRFQINDITNFKDIKYRGPFSYRHLRIFGWLFIEMSQIAIILGIVSVFKPELTFFGDVSNWLNFFATLSLPLFLLANFSFMLRAKNNGYKQLLLFYGGISVLFFLIYIFVTHHYIMNILMKAGYEYSETVAMLDNFANTLFANGMALNVFLDLFLCTLLFFFIDYRPKNHFKGKKIYIFRSMVILPIVYEITSITLKAIIASKSVQLPNIIIPLLTNKPPLTFIAFVCLALFIKLRGNHYVKKGFTEQDYEKFLLTNRNSLDISIATSVIFVVVSILDIIIAIIMANCMKNIPNYEAMITNMGFGKATSLFFAIPFIMLFSYTRQYKNTKFDTLLPLCGVGLIAFTYIEGLFIGIIL